MYPHYSFQHSVLIIDDFKKSEKLIREGLLSHPMQFEFCKGDYELALNKLFQLKPDVVIISLEFEKGSILDFAKKILGECANTPSIFMTEPHLLNVQESVSKLGSVNIIDYPEEPSVLIHRIQQIVAGSRSSKKVLAVA